MADISDIFVNSVEDNALEVQNAVNDLMQQKVADAINQLRGEISGSYFSSYGGEESQEQDDVEEVHQDDYTEDATELDQDEVATSYEDSSLEDLLQELEDADDQENS